MRSLRWGTAVAGAALAALGLVVTVTTAPAGADSTGAVILAAVGGSGSVGEQPTLARPRGAPTDSGYANDLLSRERAVSDDMRLVHFGCPGETTATMIGGGDHCHYVSGSQLGDVVSFLDDESSSVLMTVDLGFNDVLPCLRHHAVDQPCVTRALALVQQQLPQIVSALTRAGGTRLRLVGVGHYDPFLGAYVRNPAYRPFAAESASVMSRLNDVLHSVYAAAGVPMADVAASFDMTDTEPTALAGIGLVPRDVARTCDLTFMCAPPPLGSNEHPNDAGYRAISDAIATVLGDR